MLAVSPLRNPKNERENQMEKIFSSIENQHIVEFPDFSSDNLLDSIDFDDLFVGINGGDLLPDLEMESPDILDEFAVSSGEDTISEVNMPSIVSVVDDDRKSLEKVGPDAASGSSSVSDHGSGSEEAMSKTDRELVAVNVNPLPKEGEKGRKSTRNTKKTHGKRKVKKVDWTPELHRRFVQAVEQLGVDKAVPSRILQLIGIDCLTRHNIASHLQKYRSHRKHLLAREAEAASWNRRQQMCRRGGAAARKGDHVNPWIAPTIGYPSMAPMPHFRPLYVWGHPSVDQSLMPMWPKHLSPPPPMHAWPPAQPPRPSADRHSYWIPHHHRWSSTPPVPGVPPPGLASGHTLFRPPSDVHPSKESVDAAIGDVLSKPWLPLPLGLKPPSVDSVMVELHRRGISKIPPSNLCLIN